MKSQQKLTQVIAQRLWDRTMIKHFFVVFSVESGLNRGVQTVQLVSDSGQLLERDSKQLFWGIRGDLGSRNSQTMTTRHYHSQDKADEQANVPHSFQCFQTLKAKFLPPISVQTVSLNCHKEAN